MAADGEGVPTEREWLEGMAAKYKLSRWERLCWWLAAILAPKDGSRYGPSVFGRSVKHDPPAGSHD